MSEILRSAVAGYVPTVNQLETTILGIGYNRADAKLYGLKVVGTAKSVVLLNGDGTGGDPYEHPSYEVIDETLSGATVLASFTSDAIGSITGLTTRTLTLGDLGYSAPADGILDWDGTAYAPYSAKQAGSSLSHFYTDVLGLSGSWPTGSEYLFYNGYQISRGFYTGTALNECCYIAPSGLTIVSSTNGWLRIKTVLIADPYEQYALINPFAAGSSIPIYIGAYGASHTPNNSEYVKVDDNSKVFDINMTNVRLNKGTASKYYGTDANRYLVAMADPLTASDQYWQRVATTLSPLTTGDIIRTTGNIVAGDDDETAVLSTNKVAILGKGYYPQLDFIRKGAAGGAVQSTDQLGHISVYGYYNSVYTATAFRIGVTASETWSSSARGTVVDFISVADGQTAQLSRIRFSGAGNVIVNENGEPTNFRVEGDTDQNLFLVDGVNDRVGISTDGSVSTKFHVKTPSDWGQETIKIEQTDEDKAFIDFVGTSAANSSKNISTYNSGGSVVGPKGANSTDDFWKYEGMVRVEVNGAENRWMPVYSYQQAT